MEKRDEALKTLTSLMNKMRKNREKVPIDVLKTKYKVPYEMLKKQIVDASKVYVGIIIFSDLRVKPENTQRFGEIFMELWQKENMPDIIGRDLGEAQSVEDLTRHAEEFREKLKKFSADYLEN